jgi:hypothetical protein
MLFPVNNVDNLYGVSLQAGRQNLLTGGELSSQ